VSADFAALTLVEAAEAISTGAASAREVTAACIARVERLQSVVNCFTTFDPEGALAQADRADAKRAAGEPLGPLHGVPLAHKDMFYRQGVVTTCGSRIRRDFRPAYTATVLERLEAAGALHLGGLNMSEFALGPTGHNAHYGPARNPWNPEYITGGSSSGSGAATAARLAFAALGSDTAGSVRLPAAACGVVGIKPTQTRVSRHGMMGLSFSLDCVGLLARTVRDCARVLGVVAGHDPRDATSSRQPVPDYEAATLAPDVAGLRIGIPENFYYDTVDDDVRERLEASLAVFESLGARRIGVRIPDHEHLAGLANALQWSEAATLHEDWLRKRPEDYGPQVRARLELGFAYSATQYLSAAHVRPGVIRSFVDAVFGQCDILHLPAIPIALPTIAETGVEDRAGFAELLASLSCCTRPINYLALPGLSLPAGFDANGLPTAFQLVGRPFAESTLFRAGAAYEAATDWTRQAPPL